MAQSRATPEFTTVVKRRGDIIKTFDQERVSRAATLESVLGFDFCFQENRIYLSGPISDEAKPRLALLQMAEGRAFL